MSATNVYGPSVSVAQVEKLVIGALEDWLPFYLGERERLDGYEPGDLPIPLGYVRASEFAKWPEDSLPVVLVVSPGTSRIRKRDDGKHEISWNVGVAPVVKDRSQEDSRDLASAYGTAIRDAIVQHKLLRSTRYPDGIEGSVELRAESYTDLAFDSTRTLGTAHIVFEVSVDNAVSTAAGPRELPTEPPDVDPGDWPPLAPGYPHVEINPVEVLA